MPGTHAGAQPPLGLRPPLSCHPRATSAAAVSLPSSSTKPRSSGAGICLVAVSSFLYFKSGAVDWSVDLRVTGSCPHK